MAGVRAEIRIDTPPCCPAAQVSETTGETVSTIRKSVPTDPEKPVTEEFILEEDESLDSIEADTIGGELREVFSYGAEQAFRFTRSQYQSCPCDRIERYDCPVLDVYARKGTLVVSFHAPDIDTLRAVIGELKDAQWDVSVHRLIRSKADHDEQKLVLVDRSDLTERQQEVLTTAHEMGYFDHPKGANAGDVAEVLEISASTFTEHLAAAQGKILSTVLDD